MTGNTFISVTETSHTTYCIHPSYTTYTHAPRTVEREERGKFSRTPRHLMGAPRRRSKILKKGIPDGFFPTWNMHKIYFEPRWGSLRRSPRLIVGWWSDTPPHVSSLSMTSASRSRERIRNEVVTGPRALLWISTACMHPFQISRLYLSYFWDCFWCGVNAKTSYIVLARKNKLLYSHKTSI